MAFKKGHKHSVGNKGGGRKSFVDEKIMAAVVNRSWDILDKALDSDMDEDKKRHVALEIAKKTIPKTINADVKMKIEDILDACDK